MRRIVGTHDLLFVTLDTLRYDVACRALDRGMTPHFQALLPQGQWEERHSPGSFTYAAHQAFFAGFWPTPAIPGDHVRPMALKFQGSKTIGPRTCVFDAPNIIEGLSQKDYLTLCVGGVGFFNKRNHLARVLPNLFEKSFWQPAFGVTRSTSTQAQFSFVGRLLREVPAQRKVFTFINVSALHPPHRHYVEGAKRDSCETQMAALQYVDQQLPRLLDAIGRRGKTFCVFCSDHGTTFGEEGFQGHRIGHPIVWTVPYAHFVWNA